MDHNFRHIKAEPEESAHCVMFARSRLTEQDVLELGDEIMQLAEEEKCPRIIFDFVSATPECLFSVFLAKLVSLQKKLEEQGGGLHLCNCNPQVISIFAACCLDRVLRIFDSRFQALEAFPA